MSSVWQRSTAIHVAIDTYHFHDLLYRRFILIHFELAKSGDTLNLHSDDVVAITQPPPFSIATAPSRQIG
ncbi:hypothetical protein Y032_0088g2151 [Ancylostoma ceylanicum]|uniref:Uncharacterized protein n=1 Tax=Ancylostoma ceylanicum TaxID=53326 RepID=A0A016TPD9_9BILA|nr:hypothetical protein Y032_0088g2151 [Ancylostoma ceylanicum]